MKRTLLAIALLAASASARAVLICTSANDYDPDETVTWYIGQPAPSINVGAEQFVSCAATGNELAYVRASFAGIPMRGTGNSRTMIWRGDMAKFVIENLV